MRRWMIGLAVALLWACGGGPSGGGTHTPDGVVAAWIAAVQAKDAERAYSLGAPAWASRERAWKQGFTRTLTRAGGPRIEVLEQSPAQLARGEALVRVRARMHRPDGSVDNEGLSFGLRQIQGRWRIVGLH